MTMIRNLMPQLSERGKIKIGRKGHMITSRSGTEFQPPQKLDHFVVTTLDRDETGNFCRDNEAHALYGEKPTSLPIRMLFDDVTGNFSSRYACFVSQKLWCTGDGVEATRQNGAGPVRVACPCERIQPSYQGKDRCKFNGALSVVIDGMAGVGGVWKFRTTSYNSVVNIMSALAQIKLITGGPLSGIPLNLVLRAKQVASPADGKMQTIYVVTIEYPGSMQDLRDEGLRRLRQQIDHRIQIRELEQESRRLLLPSPEQAVFDGEEEDDVAQEFYPETIDRTTGEVRNSSGQDDPDQRASASAPAIAEQQGGPDAGGDAPRWEAVSGAPAGNSILKQQLKDSIALENQRKYPDTPALEEHVNDPKFHSILGENDKTVDLFKKVHNEWFWKRTAVKEAVKPLFRDLDAAVDLSALEAVPMSEENKLRLELCKLAVPIWATEFYRRFELRKEDFAKADAEELPEADAEEFAKADAEDPGRYLGA